MATATVETKTCRGCGEAKPLSDFHRKKQSPDGRAPRCRSCVSEKRKDWHRRNPEKAEEYRRRHRERHPERVSEAKGRHQKAWLERLREAMFEAYGARCKCCGEERREFLTLDHRDGRPESERGLKTSSVMVRARDEGWPDRFRILCWNCNCSQGLLGYCPHELEARAELKAV